MWGYHFMLSGNLPFNPNFNFGTANLMVNQFQEQAQPFPPVSGDFNLLNGSDFLLLDGTKFLLL